MAMIETNFIRPQEVYDRNTGESKVRYRSYDGNDRFIPVVNGEKGVPKTMVEVTHAELKAMRDGGKLTAGALYRITDYNCTTTQENTQSAGHQFDIVLLALSENKLAEEGWAMEHPTDIYDVTFVDSGTVSKCYIYYNGSYYNIVRVSDLIGGNITTNITIDEENKTAIIGDDEEVMMTQENLPYNYFQNSNLSAWKVWYSLDNDKSRFAWADDSVDEDSPASIEVNGGEAFERSEVDDVSRGEFRYAWRFGDFVLYTQNTTPSQGDSVYFDPSGIGKTDEIEAYNPPQEGTGLPNGRGVIYRLIDEWNNDVGYDFKNIQFIRPISGENTWVYTYTWYDLDKNIAVDTSLDGGMMDGFIGIYNGTDSIYELSNNVIANPSGYSIKLVGTSGYCTISGSSGLLLYNCDSLEIEGVDDAIYVAGKKVLTEE